MKIISKILTLAAILMIGNAFAISAADPVQAPSAEAIAAFAKKCAMTDTEGFWEDRDDFAAKMDLDLRLEVNGKKSDIAGVLSLSGDVEHPDFLIEIRDQKDLALLNPKTLATEYVITEGIIQCRTFGDDSNMQYCNYTIRRIVNGKPVGEPKEFGMVLWYTTK